MHSSLRLFKRIPFPNNSWSTNCQKIDKLLIGKLIGNHSMNLTYHTKTNSSVKLSELVFAAQQQCSLITRLLFDWLSLDFQNKHLIYHPENHYYYSEIMWGSHIEFVLILWPPNSVSGCHDHQGSFNILHCLFGELQVFNFACHHNQLRAIQSQKLTVGETATTLPYQIHEVMNPSPLDWACSLHIYFPVRQS